MHLRSVVALAVLVALPALSGCLSAFTDDDDDKGPVAPADVGFNPSSIRVTQVVQHEAMVPSFDGTNLAVIVYEPKSSDTLPDGSAPTWGTVLFAHGWGLMKETYRGFGGTTGAPVPSQDAAPYTVDRLQAFADAGLIAVAYDARGFGQSDGTSTIAGAAELQDLEAVRAWAQSTFDSNGLFGVVGNSYGAGQALRAWVENPAITTVVPMYGWADLYDGLLPGNVPKAQWAALLGGVGVAGSQGQVSPILAEWYQKGVQRSDLGTVEAEMAARSVAGRMGAVTKPLFTCQGMQETLFPQVDRVWGEAGGFTRALVFTGGHGTQDERCWAQALDWFRYFLGGFDTGVAGWPALTTVDADGGRALDYAVFPVGHATRYYLDTPNLETGFPSTSTFTIAQRVISNPLQEPSGLWDQSGQPVNPKPERFLFCGQDPTIVCFETAPFTTSEVVLGAPRLRLDLATPDAPTPFQVVGELIHVDAAGQARALTRGAVAAIDAEDVVNGTVTMDFPWVKADLAPGDKLVLKLGGNDSSWFLPLPANYSTDFRGTSELHVPFFLG